ASLIGVACEKPLARNVAEARRMVERIAKTPVLHGYLENQVFSPSVARGKEIIWRRAVPIAGRPYLARAAEEHGGPHEPWFWKGREQGGGVLNDMMCHSIEAARFLLTDPRKGRDSLKPRAVSAEIATLKWARPEYVKRLKQQMGVDYSRRPSEDFARATVTWEDEEGRPVLTEVTTSWSFMGPGLRLSMEVVGPEYFMQGTSLNNHLQVFFSREVRGKEGEDLVEKQAAEQGLMPVVPEEESEYGYTAENRHMVECFRTGRKPTETFEDGLEVTRLLMACYMSAERGERLAWPPKGLDEYVPAPAREEYAAEDVFKGKK
ncbi:MAG: Gfo/Idh/MocA family protein, partial [Planctomycetota bacterium]